jgi:hypothetical protein
MVQSAWRWSLLGHRYTLRIPNAVRFLFKAHVYQSWSNDSSIEYSSTPEQAIEGAGCLSNARASLLNDHVYDFCCYYLRIALLGTHFELINQSVR